MHPVDLVLAEEDQLRRCVLPSRRHSGRRFGEHAETRLVSGRPMEGLVPFVDGIHKEKDINWREFERTGGLMASEKREQSVVDAMIVVDRLASMAYGEAEQKSQLAQAVVGALTTIHAHQQDTVGLIAFNGFESTYLPAMSGGGHFYEISQAAALPPVPQIATTGSLAEAMEMAIEHRGPVHLVSDFSEPDIEDALAALASVNETTAFRVVAQSDVEVPNVCRLVHPREPLSGSRTRSRIDFRNKNVRKKYGERVQARTERLEGTFNNLDIPSVELRTDQNWLEQLLLFLSPEQWKVR